MPIYIENLVNQVATTTVGFASDVVSTFYPLILGFAFLGGIIYWIRRKARV